MTDPLYGVNAQLSHQKGLMTYADYVSFNQNNRTCSLPSGVRGDGVVTREAAKRIVTGMGLSGVIPDGHDQAVSAYGKLVDDLFGGDYRKLLIMQHTSKPDEFFGLIGRTLGSSPNEALRQGTDYFNRILDEAEAN